MPHKQFIGRGPSLLELRDEPRKGERGGEKGRDGILGEEWEGKGWKKEKGEENGGEGKRTILLRCNRICICSRF